MNNLPRKSKFTLTADEKNTLLEHCEKEVQRVFTVEKKSSQHLTHALIGWLYQEIAHLDFDAYTQADSNIPQTQKIEDLKIYLAKRAHCSAMLQAFEEDVSQKGYRTEKKFTIQEGVVGFKENFPEIYHGTNSNVPFEELGEPDENGKYAKLKDGILYFTYTEETAKKFAKGKGEFENIDNVRVLARKINSDNECVQLDNILTTCDTGALYQEDLIELSNSRNKICFFKYQRNIRHS